MKKALFALMCGAFAAGHVVAAETIEVLNIYSCVTGQNGDEFCPAVQEVSCPGGPCWAPFGAIVRLCVDDQGAIVTSEVNAIDDGTGNVPKFVEAPPNVPGNGLLTQSSGGVVCYKKKFCGCKLAGDDYVCYTKVDIRSFVLVNYTISPNIQCVNAGIIPL